jgi:BirA family biotin operon repressor/biotin-[acetyl-CoA-carboxylase] ligase
VGVGATSFDDLHAAAQDGASHGTFRVREADDVLEVAVVLRPAVGMAFLMAVPHACSLGVRDALLGMGAVGVGVAWPHDVCGTGGTVATIQTHAGYGEGMFVVCGVSLDLSPVEGVVLPSARELGETIAAGIVARVDAWAAGIVAAGSGATPLGPILADYYDALALMDADVEVVYPNGRVFCRGRLAGIDVWGRATVCTSLGGEIEVAPEQVSIRAAE